MVKLLVERFRIVSPYDFYAIHGKIEDKGNHQGLPAGN
jgi:hypothetical protein